jgi:hypothetical protein
MSIEEILGGIGIVMQFVGVTFMALIAAATLRVVYDLIRHGHEMIREYREAPEEDVLVGMYVDHDGKVVYKTKRKKKFYRI